MKRFVAILMIIIITVMFAVVTASAEYKHEIMNQCYDFFWKVGREKLAECFEKIEDYHGIVIDNRLYDVGGWLDYEISGDHVWETKENLKQYLKEVGGKHFDVHVYTAGRTEDYTIIYIEINCWTDWNSIQKSYGYYDYGEEIYGMDILMYVENYK